MPVLPQFQARTDVAPALQQRVSPEFGQEVPRAMQRAGAALDVVATSLNENAATEGRIQLTERLAQVRAQIENETDPNAIRERWRTESEAAVNEVSRSLGPFVGQRVRQYGRVAVAHEARGVESLVARRTTEATEANIMQRGQQLARQATDPALRDVAMGEYAELVASAVRTGAISAQRGEALRQRFMGNVDEAAALNAILRNPGQAARDLANPNGPYQHLEQDARTRLAMQADNRAQSMAARAEAAAGRRDRAISMNIQQVNGLLGAGIVPEDRIAELTRMARGTAYEPVIAQMVADARVTGELARLPAAQQLERLQAVGARVRAGNATDADLAQYQRLSRIVQQQQADLDRDGLGRGVRDGIIGPLPALDPANPDSLNARVEAAQAMTVHSGRPVGAFTEDEARQMAQRFNDAQPPQRMAILQSLMQINDRAVRDATLRQFERIRGDAGRLPAGSLLRMAELMQHDPVTAQNFLSTLSADVSDRSRPQREGPELNAALQRAAADGILAVRNAQAGATNYGPYYSSANLDFDLIRHYAAARMMAGVSPDAAVREAAAALNRGRAFVNDPRLAMVIYPEREAPQVAMRQGFERLREQAAAAVQIPDGEGGIAARQRQAAIRAGFWINHGDGFRLVTRGENGNTIPVPAEFGGVAGMSEVLRAARVTAAATRTDTPEGQSRVSAGQAQAGGGFTPPAGAAPAVPLGGSTRRRPAEPPQMR